jgi:hypothetical protein
MTDRVTIREKPQWDERQEEPAAAHWNNRMQISEQKNKL